MSAILNGVLKCPAATTDRPTVEIPEAIDLNDIGSLGGGLRVVSTRKERFNHELAERLLSMADVPCGDRPLNNRHVEYLIGTIKRGTFRPELVRFITCVCKEDGKTYRINGQHTCWARMELPNNSMVGVEVDVSHYSAATLQDVRMLYASVDRGMSRTKGVVINTYLAGSEVVQGASPKVVRLAAAGLSLWLWETNHERSKHDGDDIAYLMQTEYVTVTAKVIEWMQTAGNNIRRFSFLCRSPISAGMFETFDKSAAKAKEFWDSVRDGTGFAMKSDPRLKLRNELMQSTLNTSRTARPVTNEEMYRWVVYAWNAWRRNEELTRFVVPQGVDRPKAK